MEELCTDSSQETPARDGFGRSRSALHRFSRSFAGIWLVSSVLVALLGGAWALATPFAAPPDEIMHVMHADAVSCGQLVGGPVKGQLPAFTLVRVPRGLQEIYQESFCFNLKAGTSAQCETVPSAGKDEPAIIDVGRYPPLYYLMTALPALFIDNVAGLFYAMRLLSVAACALFLGLAMAGAVKWCKPPLLAVSLLIAWSPMVLFLVGSVNPNSLEICMAAVVWVSALSLVRGRTIVPAPAAVRSLGITSALMVWLVGSDPFVLLLILVTVGVAAGRRRIIELVHMRNVQIWAVVVVLSTLGAIAWVLDVGSLDLVPSAAVPGGTTNADLIVLGFGQAGSFLKEYVGVLGSLDTFPPLLTVLAWVVAVGFLVGIGLVFGQSRIRVALIGSVAASLLLPVGVWILEARRLGLFNQQGRYWLPFVMGVPLLAACAVDAEGSLKLPTLRTARFLVVVVAVGLSASFLSAMQRYTVGITGPINPLDRPVGSWAPPLGAFILDILFCLAVCAYGLWALRLARVADEPNAGFAPYGPVLAVAQRS